MTRIRQVLLATAVALALLLPFGQAVSADPGGSHRPGGVTTLWDCISPDVPLCP
jgi:hypothetical protein